ncbi:MAG TPA: hypothetical protein VMG31_10905 [Verrucomicrobiae bacterium]|nr:hypothetical protein [Verrucomicrobiae bacterium]
MNTKTTRLRNFATLLLPLALCAFVSAQTGAAPAADPHAVPQMDGGIGPCSADVTVADSAGKPVYAAKVSVHIAYGFMNARKLDLEQGTNIDGRARFVGLPDRIKHGLYFRASEGARTGEAFDDPTNTCKAQFTITITKQP